MCPIPEGAPYIMKNISQWKLSKEMEINQTAKYWIKQWWLKLTIIKSIGRMLQDILGLVRKNVPVSLDFSGNLRAWKPNKSQTKQANITGLHYFPGICYLLLLHQQEWCKLCLIVYLLVDLLPQKLHQLPLFASSTLRRAPPLLRPTASPLQSTPPSPRRFASLLQSRRIYVNIGLFCFLPPLCFHLIHYLCFGPPLCLDALCLLPLKSLRLGRPPCHHYSPNLILHRVHIICLDRNGNLLVLYPLPVLGFQPLYIFPPPPDFDRGRRRQTPFVIFGTSPHSPCVFTPKVLGFLINAPLSHLCVLFCTCVVRKSTAHVGTKTLNMCHQEQNGFCDLV